ncbi:MAG: prepilin peptidase, partial [Myxococcales bacterium]|nr:prepilin peptidase [Myxococcales bacterium]
MSDGPSLAASAAVLQVFAFVWGTVWGSFLNVVIYRLPAGGSLVHPPSTCGRCGTRIAWYDNVPVLSYLLLRGRCRACGVAYGPRYALVELLCGVLCLALLRAAVLPLTDVEALVHALWMWLWLQAFVYLLVAITFIDLDHLWIPDELSFLGLLVGLAGAFFLPVVQPTDHVFGAFGAAAFMLAIAGLGRLIFGREALGLGDAKLLT